MKSYYQLQIWSQGSWVGASFGNDIFPTLDEAESLMAEAIAGDALNFEDPADRPQYRIEPVCAETEGEEM